MLAIVSSLFLLPTKSPITNFSAGAGQATVNRLLHLPELKERANQAGASAFVDPDLVRGTLIEGFSRLDDLDSAWERSVYV
ncbi:MAG: hypothetical protein ACYCPT_08290 [Acidimicrobiales bacterium]